jgi:glycosyltransferase involved in cell wall biosynthesis
LLEHNRGVVEFVGEIGDAAKQAFLGNARALLFPIVWPEPFGLVMIESMACGTPVIAFRNGSVPEILEPGVSGYICDGVAEAIEAVERVGKLDRLGCREAFERRFSSRRMAMEYIDVYADIIASLRMRHRPLRTGTSATNYMWLR